MITNKGKSILAKFLVGQSPSYASYIAVGCGAKPLATDATLGDYSEKTELDFEMFRVPIISRGYVNEDGISKVVFTGEMPTEERYEISEIGIFSAGSNPAAGNKDSKVIYSFVQNENWEYHTDTVATAIPIIYNSLDSNDNNVIEVTDKVFQTNADNKLFTDNDRVSRYERCRFLNNIIMIAGDTSTISADPVTSELVIDSGNHIHQNGVSVNFNKNAATDKIKLAFSVINKDGNSAAVPENVKLIVEFASSDAVGVGEYAKFEVDIDNGTGPGQNDFASNRYIIVERELQELKKSPGFSWGSVNIAKIYVCITHNGEPSSDFYVGLDALRLENVSDVSPLYGLTGYSVLKNIDAETIIKRANTTNFIEFRFAIGVE